MSRQSVSIGVLFDDHADGLAGILTLEQVPGGPTGCYPNPVAMTSTSLAEEFLEAITGAWASTFSLYREQASVRWRITLPDNEPLEHLPPLRGKSLGAAFGLALRHLLDESSPQLEAGWAITGAMEEAGVLRSVEGYERKLRAAKRQGWRVVYPASDNSKVSQYQAAAFPAKTLDEASQQASGSVRDISRYLEGLVERLERAPEYFPRGVLLPSIQQRVRVSQGRRRWDQEDAQALEAARRSGAFGNEELRRIYFRHDQQKTDGSRVAQDDRSRIVDWDQLRDRSERLVILGDPGFGKTYLLKNEAIRLARRSLALLNAGGARMDDVALPIFIPLPALSESLALYTRRSGTFVEAIQQVMEAIYSPPELALTLLIERLREHLDGGVSNQDNLWLFLDSWDEVDTRQRERVTQALQHLSTRCHCRVLLTSRIAGYEGSPLPLQHNDLQREVELLPFGTAEVEGFVAVWFEDDPDQKRVVSDAIERGGVALQGLVRIPLLLSFVCALASQDRPIPGRRVELYEGILRLLLDQPWREGPKPDEDLVELELEALQELAWAYATYEGTWHDWLTGAELRPVIQRGAALRELHDHPKVAGRGVLGELSERVGVLVKGGTGLIRGQVPYLWLHRSFQEFLVARRLAQRPETEWRSVVLEHCWYKPDWVEPISLLGGTLTDATPLVVALAQEDFDILDELLFLSGRVVAEARIIDPDIARQVSRAVARAEFASMNRFSKPGENFKVSIRLCEYVVPRIIEYLESQHSNLDIQLDAIDALGDLGDPRAVPVLVHSLNDMESRVRSSAAYALVRLGDSRAVPALIMNLETENDDSVIEAVTRALGRLGDRRAVPALIAELYRNDRLRRDGAANALGAFGDQKARSFLRDRLHDAGKREKLCIVRALRDLGDADVIAEFAEELHNNLAGSDPQAREATLIAFAVLDELPGLEVMRQCLSDPDQNVRYEAANRLRLLKDDNRTLLIALRYLVDESPSVRSKAAETLGKLGDPSAVPELMVCLEDDAYYVRRHAAMSLGLLGDPRAVPALTASLSDDDGTVRYKAAESLGLLGDPNVVPALIVALEDDDEMVRCKAAESLGLVGSLRAVPALRASLADDGNTIRTFVRSEDDETYRVYVALALGRLADSSTIIDLVTRIEEIRDDLSDDDTYAELQNLRIALRNSRISRLRHACQTKREWDDWRYRIYKALQPANRREPPQEAMLAGQSNELEVNDRSQWLISTIRTEFVARYDDVRTNTAPEILDLVLQIDDPGHFADILSTQLIDNSIDRQSYLADLDPASRLERIYGLLTEGDDVSRTPKNSQAPKTMRLSRYSHTMFQNEDDCVPLLALANVVIFPRNVVTMLLGRKSSIQAIERATDPDRRIAVTLLADSESRDMSDGAYVIGTVCEVVSVEQQGANMQVVLEGLHRIRILEVGNVGSVHFARIALAVEESVPTSPQSVLKRFAAGLKLAMPDLGRVFR